MNPRAIDESTVGADEPAIPRVRRVTASAARLAKMLRMSQPGVPCRLGPVRRGGERG